VKRDFTREAARQYLYENARRQTDDLVKVGRIAIPPLEFAEVEFGAMRTPLKFIEQLSFVECGATGGRFSAVVPRWVGSRNVVCKQIEGL